MDQLDIYDTDTTKFEWETIWIKKCKGQRKGEEPTRYKATTKDHVKVIGDSLNNFITEELNLFPNQYIKPIFDKDSYKEIKYHEDMEMIRYIFPKAKIYIARRKERMKNGKMFWSARYIVDKVRIRACQLYDLIKNEKKIPDDYFDLTKYGKGGQFFTLYNDKKYDGEVPPLMPYNDINVDPLNYYATYVKEEWENYDKQWEALQCKLALKKEADVVVEYKDDEDIVIGRSLEIDEVISRFAVKRADSYDSWIKVNLAIINYAMRLKLSRKHIEVLIHTFSKKSELCYEEDKVDLWITNNFDRIANSVVENKLSRNYLINVCLKEDDPKYWADTYKYRDYKAVLAKLNKECVKVRMNGKWIVFRKIDKNNSEPYYLFDNTGLRHYYECEEAFMINHKAKNKAGEEVIVSINIMNIAEKHACYWTDVNMRSYDNIVYNPCFDGVMNERYFNTWEGWNVMKYETCKDYSKCEIFLKHLKEVWCGDDELSYKWFLEYMSVIVRGGRTCAVPIIRGEQGCGKDCFMTDLFMNKLLGKNYCMMTNDPVNQLFGKFNSALLNKSLVVIAEGSYDMEKCYDNLKDLVTNAYIRVEKKFADIISAVNYTNFIISTNKYDIIKGCSKNRRIGYWNCSDKYKGNKAYFDKFYEALNDDSAVSAFYNLLLDKEMVNQVDIEDLAYLQNTMPETKLSKDISIKNTPIVSQFLNGFFKVSKLDELIKEGKPIKVKRSELYMSYKSYIDRNGYERLKLDLFSAQLLNLHKVECKKHSEYWFIFSLDVLKSIRKNIEILEKDGEDFGLEVMTEYRATPSFEDDE